MTERVCDTCRYARLAANSAECTGCFDVRGHPRWTSEHADAADLRDEFAKVALPALIAKVKTLDQPLAAQADSITKCAYIIADAMLKARGE